MTSATPLVVAGIAAAGYPVCMGELVQPDQLSNRPGTGVTAMLRGFARMPLSEKALFASAWGIMGLAAIALRLLPFRSIARLFGKPIGAVGCIPLADPSEIKRARMVRRAILRAARIAPFRADCLPQALAAALLCRLLGVPASIHLGVKRDDSPSTIAAHAWVCSGPEAVTGGRSFGAYTPVTCFLPAHLAARS